MGYSPLGATIKPSGLTRTTMYYNQVTTHTDYIYDASSTLLSTDSVTTYGYFDLVYLILKTALGIAVILLLMKKRCRLNR